MQTEQRGQEAFNIHLMIKENEFKRRKLLLDNMAYIHEMHAKGLYKDYLGDPDASWSAYLGQFDTFYTRSKIYTLDKVYGKFIKELGLSTDILAEIPHSKLAVLIPIVTKENVNEWLVKARELTAKDFEDEIRMLHGKVSYLVCEHKHEKTFNICESCGFKHSK